MRFLKKIKLTQIEFWLKILIVILLLTLISTQFIIHNSNKVSIEKNQNASSGEIITQHKGGLFSIFGLFLDKISVKPKSNYEPKNKQTIPSEKFIFWKFDPKAYDIGLFWKDKKNNNYKTPENLKAENTGLIFITNAGIYDKDYKPLGLHIQDSKQLHELNMNIGDGNFYLKPNGVFFITNDGTPKILETNNYYFFWNNRSKDIKLATQSGPLLLYGGKIHPELNPNSSSNYNRNAVCIDNFGQIFFVFSITKINMYELADFLKNNLNCIDGLYLDGEISFARDRDQKFGNYDKYDYVGMIGIYMK